MGMRKHNGHIIDEDFVSKVKTFWHVHGDEMDIDFEGFIRLNTGWTHDEFVLWVANGRLPQ